MVTTRPQKKVPPKRGYKNELRSKIPDDAAIAARDSMRE
jgi:hypothetical protein